MARKNKLAAAIDKSRMSKEQLDAAEAEASAAKAALEKRVAEFKSMVPTGYQEQSTDCVGFWPQDGLPIHFIPMECRMMDSSIDKTKSSTLVIGKLLDGTELMDADGILMEGKPGDIIGVWAKPGMAALANLCGCSVFMYLNGTKDVGKASPMAVFAVMSKGKGVPIPVTRDMRMASRNSKDALGLMQSDAGE